MTFVTHIIYTFTGMVLVTLSSMNCYLYIIETLYTKLL